jgi:hypothetical protein
MKNTRPSDATDAGLYAHPMYSASDLAYLRGRGYEDAEIRTIWGRDLARDPWAKPLHHRPIPDVVGWLAGRPAAGN